MQLVQIMYNKTIVLNYYVIIVGCTMAVLYNKLWKLLIDKKMSQAELRRVAGISPNTMTRMRHDELVKLAILDKICRAIGADFGDIIEYVLDRTTVGLMQAHWKRYITKGRRCAPWLAKRVKKKSDII